MSLRVIVVDDSIIFRKAVRDSLADLDGVDVVDVARDGQVAIEKIRRLRPDVITLDIEMPIMNGLEVLQAIEREKIQTNVIVVSSLTKSGASTTTQALQMGAFDFILKPNHENANDNQAELKQQLSRCIEVLKRRQTNSQATPSRITEPNKVRSQPTLENKADRPRPAIRESSITSSVPSNANVADDSGNGRLTGSREIPSDPDAICIGISTGGPKALGCLIPALNADVSVPILIVQHMPPLFTESLANHLNATSKLKVAEAEHGTPIKNGHVYIAPGGKQMKVDGYPGAWTLSVTDDPPVRGCRPSVDVLFESASQQFRQRIIAIVMTGMGDDGMEGSAEIAKRGGHIWVQDEASSTVYGMPRSVVKSGTSCEQYSLDELSSRINQIGRSTGSTGAAAFGTKPSVAGQYNTLS
ncbi:MAG: chemotaxis-specific protein-glutamate methyltransferase CheB [Planctomycetota bacterium]